MRNGYWKTKQGQWVKIKEMETSHLSNTIAMLKRKANSFKCYHSSCYLLLQGEMAQDCWEQEMDFLDTASPHEMAERLFPVYSQLFNELERRTPLPALPGNQNASQSELGGKKGHS
jgi:hypothetical protein